VGAQRPARTLRRVRWLPRTVLVVVVALAGCTTSRWDTSEINDPPPSTERVYSRDEAGVIESLVDELSTVGTNLNEWAAPRDEATCAAERIVARLGLDRLLELGYDPQRASLALSYTDEERAAVTNILVSCIDIATGLLSMITAYQKVDLAPAACFTRGVDREGLTRDFVAGLLTGKGADPFAQDTRLATGMNELMISCFDPTEDLLPVRPQAPFPQDIDATTTTTTTTAGSDRAPTTSVAR
jgi:hypothetical protein